MKTLSIAFLTLALAIPAFASSDSENCTKKKQGDRNEYTKDDYETYVVKRLGGKVKMKKKRLKRQEGDQ